MSVYSVQKLYELVVRHFLACCSQPAVGAETTVEIDIAGEQFNASGRVVLAVSILRCCWHLLLLLTYNNLPSTSTNIELGASPFFSMLYYQ
jgi:DNA topoisomerase-3